MWPFHLWSSLLLHTTKCGRRSNLNLVYYVWENTSYGCNLSKTCKCNVCSRQPPSLKGLTSHVVFNFVYNLDHFQLSSTITYDQHVFASNSKKLHEGDCFQTLTRKFISNIYPDIIFRFRECTLHVTRIGGKREPGLLLEATSSIP